VCAETEELQLSYHRFALSCPGLVIASYATAGGLLQVKIWTLPMKRDVPLEPTLDQVHQQLRRAAREHTCLCVSRPQRLSLMLKCQVCLVAGWSPHVAASIEAQAPRGLPPSCSPCVDRVTWPDANFSTMRLTLSNAVLLCSQLPASLLPQGHGCRLDCTAARAFPSIANQAGLGTAQQVGTLLTYCHDRVHEMHSAGSERGAVKLRKILDLPAIEVLDEVDELLSHLYQLIYATGERETLPELSERLAAAAAVLEALAFAPEIHALLRERGLGVVQPLPGRFGSMPSLQLTLGTHLNRTLSCGHHGAAQHSLCCGCM
jgi:Protein of unknown function (DUF3638)